MLYGIDSCNSNSLIVFIGRADSLGIVLQLPNDIFDGGFQSVLIQMDPGEPKVRFVGEDGWVEHGVGELLLELGVGQGVVTFHRNYMYERILSGVSFSVERSIIVL